MGVEMEVHAPHYANCCHHLPIRYRLLIQLEPDPDGPERDGMLSLLLQSTTSPLLLYDPSEMQRVASTFVGIMTHGCKSSYQYHPLDSDTSAIRLIELLPGHWEDPIRCDLEHTSLDATPQYEALSYMWGDMSATTTISLCGCVVRITKSLELASEIPAKSRFVADSVDRCTLYQSNQYCGEESASP